MKTDAEIRSQGMQALIDALGRIEAEKFITLLLRAPFDYTEWQKTLWPDMSIEQISHDAMKYRLEMKQASTVSDTTVE